MQHRGKTECAERPRQKQHGLQLGGSPNRKKPVGKNKKHDRIEGDSCRPSYGGTFNSPNLGQPKQSDQIRWQLNQVQLRGKMAAPRPGQPRTEPRPDR